MELTDQLLHAFLIACDQSYNGAPIDGMALQPLQDSPLNREQRVKSGAQGAQGAHGAEHRVKSCLLPSQYF